MIGLKVINEELIELIFAVGQYQGWPIVLHLLNFLKFVPHLAFVNGFTFYLLLQFSNSLLVFPEFVFILVLFV